MSQAVISASGLFSARIAVLPPGAAQQSRIRFPGPPIPRPAAIPRPECVRSPAHRCSQRVCRARVKKAAARRRSCVSWTSSTAPSSRRSADRRPQWQPRQQRPNCLVHRFIIHAGCAPHWIESDRRSLLSHATQHCIHQARCVAVPAGLGQLHAFRQRSMRRNPVHSQKLPRAQPKRDCDCIV